MTHSNTHDEKADSYIPGEFREIELGVHTRRRPRLPVLLPLPAAGAAMQSELAIRGPGRGLV